MADPVAEELESGVKIGGPCRGLARAWRLSVFYAGAYFLLGLAAIFVVGLLSSSVTEDAFTVHFWGTWVLVLPTSFAANFAFCRLFRKRTWRKEPWRVWLAGFLGIVWTWGGMVLLVATRFRPPAGLRELLGVFAEYLYPAGLLVLLSNLALLAAWLIPSRRVLPREGREGTKSC